MIQPRGLLLSLMLCVCAMIAHGKTEKSLEIGLSYNTLTWSYSGAVVPPGSFRYTRAAFAPRPTARFSCTFLLPVLDSGKVRLTAFAGYHNFGGQSKRSPDGYKDIYSFHSAELGGMISYRAWNHLDVGLGFKGNYAPAVTACYYGMLYQPDSATKSWHTKDVSDWFGKLSCNAGVRAAYRVKRFSVAAEAWYGLSNLNRVENTIRLRIKENNYRLLVGYTF